MMPTTRTDTTTAAASAAIQERRPFLRFVFLLSLAVAAFTLSLREDRLVQNAIRTRSLAAEFVVEEEEVTLTAKKAPLPPTPPPNNNDKWEPMSLTELTHGGEKQNCSWPFVPVDNIIVEGDPWVDTLPNGTQVPRKIPKLVHLAWINMNDQSPRQGKCLHYLQAETFDKYRESFPTYSIYFHDDDAVDALMRQENWPEFPHLNHILQCIKMRGAALIDFWRILITYKYGGWFADLDLWPTALFNESVIPHDVDFFSFSDSIRRPSQMSFAMAPGHPMGYVTMNTMLDLVYHLDNIYNPPLVFLTGPGTFANGFAQHYLNHTGRARPIEIERNGTFKDQFGGMALKLNNFETDPIGMDTNKWKKVNGTGLEYKKQFFKDTKVLHWTEEKKRLNNDNAQPMSCKHYLYQLERSKSRFPKTKTS